MAKFHKSKFHPIKFSYKAFEMKCIISEQNFHKFCLIIQTFRKVQ